MEIVNIEAETFREMLSAWNSLKSKLEELQDVCLKKHQTNGSNVGKSAGYLAYPPAPCNI